MKLIRLFPVMSAICVALCGLLPMTAGAKDFKLSITDAEGRTAQFMVDANLRLDVEGDDIKVRHTSETDAAATATYVLPLSALTSMAYIDDNSGVAGCTISVPAVSLTAEGLTVSIPAGLTTAYSIVRPDGLTVASGTFTGTLNVAMADLPKGLNLLVIPQMPTLKFYVK